MKKQCIELNNIACRRIRTTFQGSLGRQLDVVRQVSNLLGRRESLNMLQLDKFTQGNDDKIFIGFGKTFTMDNLYFASEVHGSFIGYNSNSKLGMLRDNSTNYRYQKFPLKTLNDGSESIDTSGTPPYDNADYRPRQRSWYVGAKAKYDSFIGAIAGLIIVTWH